MFNNTRRQFASNKTIRLGASVKKALKIGICCTFVVGYHWKDEHLMSNFNPCVCFFCKPIIKLWAVKDMGGHSSTISPLHYNQVVQVQWIVLMV